ncbi:YqaA family protein [Ferrovibrio sp.]|uniref:YqaA family protein n=1 Tax=Ferrovibrio sp. TaxID=1917215 RepID=UPI0026031E3C|nr:YqaA family protein [Ferrovibrio sp.]
MRQAARPKAGRALAVVSFLESSIFPIPPDVMLIPMCLANRARAFEYALICSVASVIGGMFGYAIGHFLIETVGQWIINLYGYADKWHAFEAAYAEWGVWIILIKGLTPIPYKLVTIASGAAHFSLTVFIIASIATRGVRFFLIAGLLWKFGAPIESFIEKRLTILGWVFLIGLIGGFIAVRYIF